MEIDSKSKSEAHSGRWDEAERRELFNMYVIDGLSMRDIAERTDCCLATVQRRLQKYGVPVRSQLACRSVSRAEHEQRAIDVLTKNNRRTGFGGKVKIGNGYIGIYFPEHHAAGSSGVVMEHILVAELMLGRHLKPGEVVHHIDGDRTNNRPANLMVMGSKEHSRMHALRRWQRLGDEIREEVENHG